MSDIFLPLPHDQPVSAPPYQRPKTIETFSYDEDHELEIASTSSLRPFVNPPLGADLNYGYERWIQNCEPGGRIDSLLKCLTHGGPDALEALIRPSVITWRGVFTKILTCCYERDSWTLNAMMVNGSIFLEEHLTVEQLRAKKEMTPQQSALTYHGYAFESYCTPSEGDISSKEYPPGWGGFVNNNVQFCHIIKSKIGDARLIMGGEVDCFRDRYTGQTSCLMELKTSMEIQSQRDEINFERKLLKFWAQSFLLGVPEIFVGFRSRQGTLKSTGSFKTMELPSLVRGKGRHAWDAGLCLNFAEKFLLYLRQTLEQARCRPSDVWRITFVPNKGLRIALLTERVDLDDVRRQQDRIGFLPRYFFERSLSQTQQSPGSN